MAEEQEVSAPKRSPLVGYLVMGGLVVVVPLVLAGLVFQFVLKPVLMPEGEEEAHAEEDHHAEVADAYPVGAMPVEFPDSQSAVLSDDPELAAPVLLYKVAMVAMDEHTQHVISEKQVFFMAMLDKLHRNRTRSELNDPQTQEAILKQAKQEANNLLKKLDPTAHDGVLDVMYVKFGLIDI
jgi:flagellar basal body-associated protein FliL